MARRSLEQQEPGTLVTAEPELGLELQGGDTVRVAGHDVNGHQPGLQGQVAAVHDRARGHRSLLPAGRTFPARPATLQFPAPVMAAGGADEAVGPALGCEMPSAGGFIGKARLEGGAGHRAVVLPAAGHDRTLSEHSADGNRKPNMSSTLVVANGGIATRPDLPRVKLNLPTMAPSLCLVDRRDGTLLQERRLDPALHQLSIRHLAVSPEDTVAVAMKYEGPAGDLVSLVALWLSNEGLRLLQGPAVVLRAMKHYCGSVCFDPSGRTIAVSAPRGGLVTFWDVGAGHYLSSAGVPDGCGVAPGARPSEFLASSGQGGVVVIDARSGKARPFSVSRLQNGRWDNHLVAVSAT